MSKRRLPKDEIIKNAQSRDEPAFIAWGEDIESKNEASKQSAGSLSEYTSIERATAAGRRYSLDYSNLDTNTSGRPGLTRTDYDYFRPKEAIPTKLKEILVKAEEIYQRVGLVKNVIDLMGDFGAQGIRLCHKNKRIERFYRSWFKKISGKDRSERFLNNLYKTGNIIINRQTGKLSIKATDRLYRAVGAPDLIIQDINTEIVEKREIPWKYTFIDPVFVDVSAGPLSSFVQSKTYELSLPGYLRNIIKSPKTDAERAIVANLPSQIVESAQSKKPYVLDKEKTIVFHYKKDDWQSWAYPMMYAIMDDIVIIEKLKLADMAALDGAISNIRIFKLGSLEHKIAPTKAATAKLAQILGNNVGGGTMDIVWGPDLELLESNTNVHQFLGEGKYIPHLNAVYAGLGIPPTLTGTYGSGTTNNFISLKTLTQRLQYGRDTLTQFWEKEIELVQRAMGFKYPAHIEFDRMDLSNEDAEKALLIQLADRNLISDEIIQSRFGLNPDMEKSRLNRETRDRAGDRMIQKSGPWHDPQVDNALKKISLQNGIVTPSQVGLELEDKKPGEKTSIEMNRPPNIPTGPKLEDLSKQKNKGQPNQGRPKNSKDTEGRKPKNFAPQTGAKVLMWAFDAQEHINSIINPVMLDFYQKKNLRSLSSEEIKEMDNIKTKIFFCLDPLEKIDKNKIEAYFTKIDDIEIIHKMKEYSVWLSGLKAEMNKDLSVEDIKQAKASFYSLVYF